MRVVVAALAAALLLGCSGGAEDTPSPDVDASPQVGESNEPAMLPTPFTAEQIRDAFSVGLVIDVRSTVQGTESVERWSVVWADPESVEIEFTPLDGAGNPAGTVRASRSYWTELRDHASFPEDRAAREQATRETPLGSLVGWLYIVTDEEQGTRSEFFFARSFPGAPVWARVTNGDEIVMEMVQIDRRQTER